MEKPAGYYDGLNRKLFDLISPGSRRILELGCANGSLGELFKTRHPSVVWVGVDISSDALKSAAKHLDHVFNIDLNQDSLASLGKIEKFDTVVIGDLLEHIISPEALLTQLNTLTTADAKIICCLPNMSHISVVQRLLSGDMSYDDSGLLDKTHLRLYSPSAAFKIFLDNGWLPDLRDQYRTDLPDTEFAQNLINTINSLGVPVNTAVRNLGMYQMVLECRKFKPRYDYVHVQNPRLTVIVPVNRDWEFELNINRSPGLQEINAEIIPVRNASSAGEAYSIGRKMASNAWCLMVHQDVYIPKGVGRSLLSDLHRLEQMGRTACPIGFAGLGVSRNDKLDLSGVVIDRTSLFNFPGSDTALSIDELAVVLHKDAKVRIDESLGWHTWGTDLCLQAFFDEESPNAVILEVPLFHNSLNDGVLSESYHASAALLLKKYPDIDNISTLCGTISR